MKNKKHRVWIHGFSGRMGQELQKELAGPKSNFILAGGSDKEFSEKKLALALADVDLIFDFSSVDGNRVLAKAIEQSKVENISILMGTTGLDEKQWSAWKKICKEHEIKLLRAANTSLGIFILNKVCADVGKMLFDKGFDIEIVETHHRMKVDAPSGTALLLADTLASSIGGKTKLESNRKGAREHNTIGIQAIRGGSVFGEHEVKFLGDNEIVTLSHRALSRSLFAQGALSFGKWLVAQKPGFYELTDVLL